MCIIEERIATPASLQDNTLVTTTRVVSTILVTATASASPDSTSYTDDQIFQKEVLNATNTYRQQHNASLVTWNQTLAAYATGWASRCLFNHSGADAFGENLAAGYSSASAAVIAWAEERRYFNFLSPDFSRTTGHFSQLVWRSTRQIGCGRVKCDGKNGVYGWFTVCEYYPRGNVVGRFKANVQKQVSGPGKGDLGHGFIGSAGSSLGAFKLAHTLAVVAITVLLNG